MLTILNTHTEPMERPKAPTDGNLRNGELPRTIIKRNIRTPDGMFPSADIYNQARGIYYRARKWERKRPAAIL
jgi:hypothetical protein